MAELLAVIVVVLFLFTILVSNYLSLTGDYENRAQYNNVTASYAAFYVSEEIKNISNSIIVSNIPSTIDEHSVFYVCYENGQNCSKGNSFNSETIKVISKEYGIEEMIITKYATTDIKNNITKISKLYKYVKYLPKYKGSEGYRLILKTSKYGYATIPVYFKSGGN